MEALQQVSDLKSFERAANVLGITQSAISQRIGILENRLGVLLIKRGKPLNLTEVGKELVNHVLKVKLLESNIKCMYSSNLSKSTTIKIVVNADSLATWWFDAVKHFSYKNKVLFNLVIEDQDEGLKHLIEGEVSGCLCSSDRSVNGTRNYPVGVMGYAFYCNKNFYERYFASGIGDEELQSAPAVIFGSSDNLHDEALKNKGYNGLFPFHICPSSEGLIKLITNGMGYGILPIKQMETIKDEAIIRMFPTLKSDFKVNLYWHYWRGGSDIFNTLTDILLSEETKGMIW